MNAPSARHWILWGMRLLFWATVSLAVAAIAMHLGAWQREFRFAGPFAVEGNLSHHSAILPLPAEEPAAWWRQPLIGDTVEKPAESRLKLQINGKDIGPPHAIHQDIRDGRSTGFSHWGSYVIFSLRSGASNDTSTRAIARYNIEPRPPITLTLLVLTMLFGLLLYQPSGQAVRQLVARSVAATSGAVSTNRRQEWISLLGKGLFRVTMVLSLLSFGLYVGGWQREFEIAGPFTVSSLGSHLFILKAPQEPAAPWWQEPLIGDSNKHPHRSILKLRIGSQEVNPPHTQHVMIRDGGPGFSHWGNAVLFTLPQNVANGIETTVTLHYSVRPRLWIMYLLAISSAVLGWFFDRSAIRSFAARYARAPYWLLITSCWILLAASTAYAAASLYAMSTGWALPTTALIRWSSIANWVAYHDHYFGYLLLTLAGFGTCMSWLTGDGEQRPAMTSIDRLSQRLLLFAGFPILACAFVLCMSAMWSGLARPGDLQTANLGGLVPFNDSHGHLAFAYNQARDGVWDPWALRRPMAAAFRSVLLFLGGYSVPAMLLLQAVLTAGAIYLAALVLVAWRGIWAGLAFVGLIYIYARLFVPTTLTEPLGIFFALLSVPFFIEALRSDSFRSAIIALALTSAALMTRMGSMFTVPALMIWLVWQFGRRPVARFRIAVISAAVVLAVFVLNQTLAQLYSSGPTQTGSNFAFVVCGLTMGAGWDSCVAKLAAQGTPLSSNEVVAAGQLYSLAWQNFSSNPSLFFSGLIRGIRVFSTHFPATIWRGYGGSVEVPDWAPAALPIAMALLGLLYLLRRNARTVERTFWAALWISIVLSASIIYSDDGARTLAASIPLIALFIALGASRPNPPPIDAATRPTTRWSPMEVLASVGLVMTAALFLSIPWLAHRISSLGVPRSDIAYHPDQRVVAGAPMVTGFLVVADEHPLPTNVPSLHLRDFRAIVALSGLENYQSLINPVSPPLPFGFIFAPRIDKGDAGATLFIAPPEVLKSRESTAWQLHVQPWRHRSSDKQNYWFYVSTAKALDSSP